MRHVTSHWWAATVPVCWTCHLDCWTRFEQILGDACYQQVHLGMSGRRHVECVHLCPNDHRFEPLIPPMLWMEVSSQYIYPTKWARGPFCAQFGKPNRISEKRKWGLIFVKVKSLKYLFRYCNMDEKRLHFAINLTFVILGFAPCSKNPTRNSRKRKLLRLKGCNLENIFGILLNITQKYLVKDSIMDIKP